MARRRSEAVILTDSDRATLLSWARSRTGSRALAQRAQIVLACEQISTSTAVAEQLGISRDMVGKWRSRFLAEGVDGLNERPRAGRPSKVNEDTVAEVLLHSLAPPPSSRREWSTRSMAAETGFSQKTVHRILCAHRLQSPPDHSQLPSEGHSALASVEVRDVTGLFLDPPTRMLAVVADGGATPRRRRKDVTRLPSSPGSARCSEARSIFAVANAFALVRGPSNTHEQSDRSSSLQEFLDSLDHKVPPSMEVHLLINCEPNTSAQDAIETWVRHHPRFRQHLASGSSWLDDVEMLLSKMLLRHEKLPSFAAALTGLRDDLRAWCSAWSPHAGPLAWTRNPRVPGSGPEWGSDRDSTALDHTQATSTERDASGERSDITRETPSMTDRVAQLVREALVTGQLRDGERVKEAPLATRLGVSRGPVREALRVLAEEGMLERLPTRGAAVPRVDATTILDLYAARGALGTLLMRQVSTLRRAELRSVNKALADVRVAARRRHSDHARIGEADLCFQDAIAQAASLPQVSLFFQRLTMRLRTFIAVLQLDFADTGADLIARENAEIVEAIRNGDGDEAVRLWHVKRERSVRYMTSYLPQEHFDPKLWATIAGKTTSG